MTSPQQAAAYLDEITRLTAENEKLKVENIQMQAALGYGILAEDERHIIPSNPYKCGTCDAIKHLRAEVEKLRVAIQRIYQCSAQKHVIEIARAALGEEG